ncbi:MAG: stage II sporulation protein R [Ruminococcaceae bacterium]|nr:stage II sporulation protein R [Oscillospiraceae bacterium]
MINTRNSYFCAAVSLLCAFALCLSSTAVYAQTCSQVREDVLRLHVIANSDSETDQNIKLLVRDRLLEVGASCFSQAENRQQAVDAVQQANEVLTAAANEVLSNNGADYTATITVKKEYFDTRTYDDITLPAGVYLAVCAVLGEGQGKNWWCVMFPPLCLPAVTAPPEEFALFDAENEPVLAAEDGYEIRFKIVELFEKWKQKIKEKQTADT